MRLLAQGAAKRRVAHTVMNRESSRSHSVFTCSVESKTTDANGITNILHARLNLVDLAGLSFTLLNSIPSGAMQWTDKGLNH